MLSAPGKAMRPGDRLLRVREMDASATTTGLPQVAPRSTDKVRASAEQMMDSAQPVLPHPGQTTSTDHGGVGAMASIHPSVRGNLAHHQEQTWQVSATGRVKYPTQQRRRAPGVATANRGHGPRLKWQEDTDMHKSRLKAIFGRKQTVDASAATVARPGETYANGNDHDRDITTPDLKPNERKTSPMDLRENASPSPPPGAAPVHADGSRRPSNLRRRAASQSTSSSIQQSHALVHPNGAPPTVFPNAQGAAPRRRGLIAAGNAGLVGSPLTAGPAGAGRTKKKKKRGSKESSRLQTMSRRTEDNETTDTSMRTPSAPVRPREDRDGSREGSAGRRARPHIARTPPASGHPRAATVTDSGERDGAALLGANALAPSPSSRPPPPRSEAATKSPPGATFLFPLWKKAKPPLVSASSPTYGDHVAAVESIRGASPVESIVQPTKVPSPPESRKAENSSKRTGFFSFLGGGKKKAVASGLSPKETAAILPKQPTMDRVRPSSVSSKLPGREGDVGRAGRGKHGGDHARAPIGRTLSHTKSAPGLQDEPLLAERQSTPPSQGPKSPTVHAFSLWGNARKNKDKADEALVQYAQQHARMDETTVGPKPAVTKLPTPPKEPTSGDRFRRQGGGGRPKVSAPAFVAEPVPSPGASPSPRMQTQTPSNASVQSTTDALGVSITARSQAHVAVSGMILSGNDDMDDMDDDDDDDAEIVASTHIGQTGASLFRQSLSPTPIQWKRGEMIGRGTYGDVFMALNQVTGELFCVKQIRVQAGGGGPKEAKSRIAALEREVSVMKGLEHPHIVRYLGTESLKSASNANALRRVYVFLEYVPGGSLAKMLRQFGAFGEAVVCRYTYQILLGLEYLHSQGIIHRDIKGANVLVSEAGIAKLADFGCSKQLQGAATGSMDESLRSIKGSIPWMAPEVIRQSGHGRSADIWSLGATVIEMVTAERPWPELDDNFAALFHVASAKTGPPYSAEVSKECRDFLAKCFEIDPDDRPAATELLKHGFVAAIAAKSNDGSKRRRRSSGNSGRRGGGVAKSSEF